MTEVLSGEFKDGALQDDSSRPHRTPEEVGHAVAFSGIGRGGLHHRAVLNCEGGLLMVMIFCDYG